MKRSSFIYYSLIGTAVVAFPALRCSNNNNYEELLWRPQLLSEICDATTLHDIGKNFRARFPVNSREQLENEIMKDNKSKSILKNRNSSSLMSFLDKKIKEDFESGRTVVINGWILSETEAQQCALFSLSQSKV